MLNLSQIRKSGTQILIYNKIEAIFFLNAFQMMDLFAHSVELI